MLYAELSLYEDFKIKFKFKTFRSEIHIISWFMHITTEDSGTIWWGVEEGAWFFFAKSFENV